MFEYTATVVKVYDADTIKVDIDLGFHVVVATETLRLARINAWEVRGEEREKGLAARDWLRDKIMGKKIKIRTAKAPSGHEKRGKYGRYIAEIIMIIDGQDDRNLNDELVKLGHAKFQSY